MNDDCKDKENENNALEAFYKFYTDLLENRRENLTHYLADNVVLHWFGHTIKGNVNAIKYAEANFACCKHYFDNLRSDHEDSKANPPSTNSWMTTEMGQGDGIHNNLKHFDPSIVKKIKLECDSDKKGSDVKCVKAEGVIEFQRGVGRKLKETRWRRPCRLHVAYTERNDDQYAYSILYVIYEGNVKCRRNLFQEFSAEEAEV